MGWRVEDSLIKRISLAWHIKKLRDELGIGMHRLEEED